MPIYLKWDNGVLPVRGRINGGKVMLGRLIASGIVFFIAIALNSMAFAETIYVEDDEGNTIAQDEDGNTFVADRNGNLAVEDEDGNIAVIDKHGNTYIEDEEGNTAVVDTDGNVYVDEDEDE